MRSLTIIGLGLALLAGQTQAATVFKCVDATGRITYTQQNCPDNNALDDVVRAHNASPSGSSEPVQMAAPRQQDQPVNATAKTASPAPVPAQQQGCSTGLSAQDERTARVRGEATNGMSRKDIESIYGKPDNTSNSNGSDHYRYWNDQKKQYVSIGFDKSGCVNYRYSSQDKK